MSLELLFDTKYTLAIFDHWNIYCNDELLMVTHSFPISSSPFDAFIMVSLQMRTPSGIDKHVDCFTRRDDPLNQMDRRFINSQSFVHQVLIVVGRRTSIM